MNNAVTFQRGEIVRHVGSGRRFRIINIDPTGYKVRVYPRVAFTDAGEPVWGLRTTVQTRHLVHDEREGRRDGDRNERWTDERGHEHALCAYCQADCSTHPDAANPLAPCQDCGAVTCLDHRVEDEADRCVGCAATFYAQETR